MEDDFHLDVDYDDAPGHTVKETINADTAAQVNVIMLWRIYDVLLLILAGQDPESAANVAIAHENGDLLGANPAFRPQPVQDTES